MTRRNKKQSSRGIKTQSFTRYRQIISHRYVTIGIEILLVLGLLTGGVYLRLQPFYTTGQVIDVLSTAYSKYLSGVNPNLFKYGYLFGNDPWIEFWLTKYLATNGISSWTSLTQNNPDTKIFWYPWGRDLAHTEYPFIPVIVAATYKALNPSMSLQEWMALLPPAMSVVMMVLGYLYIRRLYGSLAGLATLAFLAFLPASIDRTHAGFVEKEGIAMSFLIAGLLFLSLSLANSAKRIKPLIYAILAGLAFGTIGFAWGGYLLAAFAIAGTSLWLPLALSERDQPNRIYLMLLATGIVFIIISLIAREYTKISLTPIVGVTLGGTLLGYILVRIAEFVSKRYRGKLPTLISSTARLYTLLLIITGIIAVIILPYMGISGRLYFTIMWPLRGIIKFHPLLESVAEHQPVIGTQSFIEINGVLFTGLIGSLIILFYTTLKLKRKEETPLGVISFGALYSTLGLAYLLQTAGVLGSLATSALIGVFKARETTNWSKTRKRKTYAYRSDVAKTLITLVAILLITLVVFNVYIASSRSTRISGYLTSNTNLPNPAWILTLDYLSGQPKDTVVVTWWDYGYWVSVGSGKPTLADGATINTTQIEVLAKMLISDENTSSRIMRDFGLKPNKTLVLVHDIVDITNDGRAFYQGGIDIPKSYWMVRIAGAHDTHYRVSDYFVPVRIGERRVVPMISTTVKGAANAVIYRILADAAKRLNDRGITVTDKPVTVYESYLSPVDFVNHKKANTTLNHFKPEKVFAFTLAKYTLPTGEEATRYIIIAIYKWTG